MHTDIDQQFGYSAPDYVFTNADERAKTRYSALSALHDAQSIRTMERLGVSKGWSCLEVGGGGGSIASWLCSRVGDEGRVVATDIAPDFLHTLAFPNLEVLCHDIRNEGLPEQQFDLAHARLVLMHLPEREVALHRMIRSVKPGGWLVLEEMDDLGIMPDPSVNPREEELRVRYAFQHVLASHGVELRYGRLLPQQLQACGLVNLGAEASASIWKPNSPGAALLKLACRELREPILASGLISPSQYEAEMNRVDEPDFLMPSPMMWTVWGQVPSGNC